MTHDLRLFVVAGGAATTAVIALAEATPVNPYAAGGLALVTATIPVLVSHFLTRRKLRKQDTKVQEIHVLVNSRLSATLDALSAALTENIRLKDRLGVEVSPNERALARAKPEEMDLDIDTPDKG